MDRLATYGSKPALISDDGFELDYAQLASEVEALAASLRGPRRLTVVEATNSPHCIIGYLACMLARQPVVLTEPGSTERDARVADTFGVSRVFRELSHGRWTFDVLDTTTLPELHPELCILLSTSGTTGSPKLVRLSVSNIESNAAAIAEYLDLGPDERAITSLPPFYSFGMSVINSHLYAGAALLLTDESLASERFWTFLSEQRASSLAAVPYTFDLLERRGFRNHTYPSLRYLTQAGGRLSPELVKRYTQWAHKTGKSLFVMYGQTEASPRMAYVPPPQLLDNPDCIGRPIPGGAFELLNEDGTLIDTVDQPGELVYRGPNVMMGYAETISDLVRGAELNELHTGDIACRKSNGLYYIVGRKSRFSKILGLRISLDELERWLQRQGLRGIVSGDDKLVCIALLENQGVSTVLQVIGQRFGLPASAVKIVELGEFPILPSGKYDYRTVLRMGQEQAAHDALRVRTLLEAFRDVLGATDIRSTDSFLNLGGDSVHFVELSLLIEEHLGFLPENWEAKSISALELLAGSQPRAASGPAKPRSPASSHNRRSVVVALVIMGLLIGGEVALQVRSYLKTGRSAAALLTGHSTTITNPDLGILTYRPDLILKNTDGQGGSFAVNSYGLRSPEIPAVPSSNELRIMVVGASTVAGAYARTNADTFPSLLEQRLRKAFPDRTVNVINAGIEGYSISDIETLIGHLVIRLKPRLTLIYPGFNDMAGICQTKKSPNDAGIRMPVPTVPAWIMTREMISKNTVWLREPPVRAATVDPSERFSATYADTLERIVGKLRAENSLPVLVTVARAFTRVDPAMRGELAETALFYNACLNVDGLIKAGKLFNDAMRTVAVKLEVPLLDLDAVMPGGKSYFVDAGHFNYAGEQFVANMIFEAIVAEKLDGITTKQLERSH